MTKSTVIISIIISLLFTLYQLTNCSYAPDVAPNFPEGWCDLRYGKPTRTTGECICKRKCIGPKCVNSQGFIFYSYKDCPTCKCIQGDIQNIIKDDKKTITKNENVITDYNKNDNDNPLEENEEVFNLFHYLEDNWRTLFGIISSVIFIGLVMVICVLSFK